ncbi:hypothetical protein M9H77_23197 [Catharanthus roseus]|uniref:Uncharacterized protein n=1 Tax=Catharanthus roseus TaxID=4058 RepID=A0ACC0ATK3_CATRO|nr:hypothetical protein M9H77_23197 [Catharanthus roseus]
MFYSVDCSYLEERMLNFKEHLSKSPRAQPDKNWIGMFVYNKKFTESWNKLKSKSLGGAFSTIHQPKTHQPSYSKGLQLGIVKGRRKERRKEKRKRRRKGRKEGRRRREGKKEEEERKCRSGGGERRKCTALGRRREEESVAGAAMVSEFCDVDNAHSYKQDNVEKQKMDIKDLQTLFYWFLGSELHD